MINSFLRTLGFGFVAMALSVCGGIESDEFEVDSVQVVSDQPADVIQDGHALCTPKTWKEYQNGSTSCRYCSQIASPGVDGNADTNATWGREYWTKERTCSKSLNCTTSCSSWKVIWMQCGRC